jgi:transposase InsO family protein
LKEFPRSVNNNKYLLVVVDVFTRFTLLRVLRNKTMHVVAKELFHVFTDFGFPKIMQSDNGTEFVNKLIKWICLMSCIDHRLISAYHPRGNGLAERNVQTASQAIYKQLFGKLDKWDFYVKATQLFMNERVTRIHGSTPFSLMFARSSNQLKNYSNSSNVNISEEEFKKRLDRIS